MGEFLRIVPHSKQLQRTVVDKAPSHPGKRAAAELRRYASRPILCDAA